jgi:AcrR family transcriptional regulator
MNARTQASGESPPDHEPEGAHPAKQARSRELRDKAMACARELVLQGRYASTSMADIAREVGCSVGALYFRFHDKDGLFASVVEVAMAQELETLQGLANEGRYQGLSLPATVDRCVRDFVAFVQRNDNMLRVVYLRATEAPGYWNIVRLAAFKMVQVWIAAVARAAGRAGDKGFERQAGAAFWFVSSSLVYSVLIIDKPVRPLSTREQVFWLNEMVMHFIGVTVPDSLQQSAVTRPTSVRLPPRRAPRKTRSSGEQT